MLFLYTCSVFYISSSKKVSHHPCHLLCVTTIILFVYKNCLSISVQADMYDSRTIIMRYIFRIKLHFSHVLLVDWSAESESEDFSKVNICNIMWKKTCLDVVVDLFPTSSGNTSTGPKRTCRRDSQGPSVDVFPTPSGNTSTRGCRRYSCRPVSMYPKYSHIYMET